MKNKNKTINKNVLITGGASGIGRQVAISFAKKGWNIFCHYNSSGYKVKKLKNKINEMGSECHTFKADLSSKKQVVAFANKIKKFEINSLINNAGSYVKDQHFEKLSINEIEKTFMVNLIAPMILTSRIFNGMRKKRFGRIVNISSIAAKYGGSRNSMHYGCSKLGLEGLTKTLSREGADCGILVNTVRPGVIDTDFHKKYPKDMKKRVKLIPLQKMGKTEDVADLVYYLGSEKNSFITNEIITVAGGE